MMLFGLLLVGLGYFADPSDRLRVSGRLAAKLLASDIEIEATDIGEFAPLVEVLLAIIDYYPDARFKPSEESRCKDRRLYRLAKAMHYLTGKKPKTRTKGADFWQRAMEIARLYEKARVECTDTTLTDIIVQVVSPKLHLAKGRSIERSDVVKDWEKKIRPVLDRLLIHVAGEDEEHQLFKRNRVQTAVNAIVELCDLDRFARGMPPRGKLGRK